MTSQPERIQIHDPAITVADGEFFIYGTGRQFARSTDLVHWKMFTNNLNTGLNKALGQAWEEWSRQETNSDLARNTWAPDVIFNPTMGKYCMYMSINGDHYQSMIVLLTSDSPDGDWEYVGPVIYSGFSAENVARTDVPKVLEDVSQSALERYQSLTDTRINAIDASLSFDEEGTLWMTFGSWFGGIWMIQLDSATGLRDYSAHYETRTNASDAYYGIKIAGGHWASGEGSYLVHTNGYWYLFLAYGELAQRGGYQIRLFRSRNITGPYLDQKGNPAIYRDTSGKNWLGETGLRLSSAYAWAGSSTANPSVTDYDKLQRIEVSQGHNSVLGPLHDGSMFIVYHTRFADLEPETRYSYGRDHFEVRIHELLPTENGWLTEVPYEYRGAPADTGRDSVPSDIIPGTYEVITHRPETVFDGTLDEGEHLHGVNLPEIYEFVADGDIHSSSGKNVGHWSQGRDNNSIVIDLLGMQYTGSLAIVPNEADGTLTTTFSVVGSNLSLWGSRATS